MFTSLTLSLLLTQCGVALVASSNEKAFLQDFLVILKQKLQNYEKIRKKIINGLLKRPYGHFHQNYLFQKVNIGRAESSETL